MPLFKGATKMELVTKEYFNVVMNTFEQASYLERVAKEVGYPHAMFKWVTNNVPHPDGTWSRYYFLHDFDEFEQLGYDSEIVGDTQDNTNLFEYAEELNELKGSDFYHKIFK